MIKVFRVSNREIQEFGIHFGSFLFWLQYWSVLLRANLGKFVYWLVGNFLLPYHINEGSALEGIASHLR